MVLSFSFASADKCAAWSAELFTSVGRDFDATIKFNPLTGRAKSTLNCMWYLSCKAGLLLTFPLFSPVTSKLESGCSLLRIEVFLPGFSLLLNAQRNLREPGGGGHFRHFWVGMCRGEPGTLNLYQG